MDGECKCYISDAWFVGQENYLRAWAYICNLGAEADRFPTVPNWKTSDSQNRSPNGESHGGSSNGSPNEDQRTKRHKVDPIADKESSGAVAEGSGIQGSSTPGQNALFPAALNNIPYVNRTDIEFIDSIGYGRNGSVFLARVGGRDAAVKQFDLDKGGEEAYENEVAAYMRMRDAWGELVPEPLFVSESWTRGIKYLGLQLGREPVNLDWSAWRNVLTTIQKRFGVQYNDLDSLSNAVIIEDTTTGKDRLVAIDFEDATFVA